MKCNFFSLFIDETSNFQIGKYALTIVAYIKKKNYLIVTKLQDKPFNPDIICKLLTTLFLENPVSKDNLINLVVDGAALMHTSCKKFVY